MDIDESVMNLLMNYKGRQEKAMNENKKNNPEFHDANFVFCRDNRYPFIQKNVLIRMDRLHKKHQ
ncbi:hypothetical protein D3C76_1803470 [compost metagenome]